jgi:hypothetical protein
MNKYLATASILMLTGCGALVSDTQPYDGGESDGADTLPEPLTVGLNTPNQFQDMGNFDAGTPPDINIPPDEGPAIGSLTRDDLSCWWDVGIGSNIPKGEGSLCPGGICIGGRCETGWVNVSLSSDFAPTRQDAYVSPPVTDTLMRTSTNPTGQILVGQSWIEAMANTNRLQISGHYTGLHTCYGTFARDCHSENGSIACTNRAAQQVLSQEGCLTMLNGEQWDLAQSQQMTDTTLREWTVSIPGISQVLSLGNMGTPYVRDLCIKKVVNGQVEDDGENMDYRATDLTYRLRIRVRDATNYCISQGLTQESEPYLRCKSLWECEFRTSNCPR